MRVAFSIGRITWEKTTISELMFWIDGSDGSINNLVWFFIPECPSILADVFVFSLPQWWVRWEQDD